MKKGRGWVVGEGGGESAAAQSEHAGIFARKTLKNPPNGNRLKTEKCYENTNSEYTIRSNP